LLESHWQLHKKTQKYFLVTALTFASSCEVPTRDRCPREEPHSYLSCHMMLFCVWLALAKLASPLVWWCSAPCRHIWNEQLRLLRA
jgi:hypothetical protein